MSTIAQQTLNMHAIGMSGMVEYGALVKRAREQHGMTQDELARTLGRPHTFIVRIENGRNANPPDPATMRALCLTLGLSLRSQLVSIGYLDPDELEPGVAYVIREDDPRKGLLDAVAGLAAVDLEAITGAATLFARAFRGEERQGGGRASGVA